jgi:hypothetical protein
MVDLRQNSVANLPAIFSSILALALVGVTLGVSSGGCANAEVSDGRFDAGAVVADTNGSAPAEAGPAANPLPTLASLNPSEAEVGGTGPSIAVKGSGFVQSSVVRVNGGDVATTYVSDTELSAKIADALLTSTGTLKVTVFTPVAANGGGGGGESSAVDFNVVNPVPTLSALAPNSALTGSSGTTVTLTGTKFVSGSVAVFDGTDLATSFVNSTTLTAAIPAANLLGTGSFPVTVRSPSPGGGTTQSIAFTVANPSVTIAGISPGYATTGDPNTSLIVSGSGFIPASVVNFNGKALPTSYVSSNRVDTVIQASSLTTAGSYPVTVTNPSPGGGTSAPASFEVRFPAPKITSISPSTASTGSAPVTITVTGSGFVSSQSQIHIDNVAATTTFVSATQLKATIPGSSLATGGTLNIKVVTADPGGGSSNVLTFSVSNPTPAITTVSPTAIILGSAQTTITVNGSGFYAGSRVRANSTSLTTTYVSSIKLTATVPTSMISVAGGLSITVLNAAPGGGTSNAGLILVGCDTIGVDVELNAVGLVQEVFPTYDATYTYARLAAGTCPVTLSTTSTQASRMLIVQNTSNAPATLSTWANCTGTASYDAFLTVYRRATRPSSATDRQECTGVVSEGKNGAVPAALSPEAGASNWCPGLTKTNGYGVTIGVCERVVVHIQPYSMTSTAYPPPPSIKLKIE